MKSTSVFENQKESQTTTPIKTHSNWSAFHENLENLENNDYNSTNDTRSLHMKIGTNIKTLIDGNVYLKCACGFVIPIIAALYSATITCWPQHDIILHPEYWYEPIAPTLVSNILIATPAQLIGCSLVMNISFLMTTKNILIMLLSEAFGFLIS